MTLVSSRFKPYWLHVSILEFTNTMHLMHVEYTSNTMQWHSHTMIPIISAFKPRWSYSSICILAPATMGCLSLKKEKMKISPKRSRDKSIWNREKLSCMNLHALDLSNMTWIYYESKDLKSNSKSKWIKSKSPRLNDIRLRYHSKPINFRPFK
jgi:hypothetical protein